MIVVYYQFDVNTGEIVEAGAQDAYFLPALSTGIYEVGYGVANPSLQYRDLNLNAVVDKATMPEPAITDAGSDVVFSPVPRPCRVLIGDQVYVISDGSAEIFFQTAGTYTVRIESVPYLPWEIRLTVGDVLLTQAGDVLTTQSGLGLAL